MAISLDAISTLLLQLDWNHERRDGVLYSQVAEAEGQPPYGMVFSAPQDGSIFELSIGNILPLEQVQQSPHKALFLMYLLHAAWTSSFGTPEMDSRDGEVRVLLELPLADAVMTPAQMQLILQGTIRLSSRIRQEGGRVLETGQFPQPPAEQPANRQGIDEETAAKLAVMEAMQTAEGRQKIREVANHPDAPAILRQVARSMLPLADALDQAEA